MNSNQINGEINQVKRILENNTANSKFSATAVPLLGVMALSGILEILEEISDRLDTLNTYVEYWGKR